MKFLLSMLLTYLNVFAPPRPCFICLLAHLRATLRKYPVRLIHQLNYERWRRRGNWEIIWAPLEIESKSRNCTNPQILRPCG